MTDDIEKLKHEAALAAAKAEIAHQQEMDRIRREGEIAHQQKIDSLRREGEIKHEIEAQKLRTQQEIWKQLEDASDHRTVGADWAMIYLNVKSRKTLDRHVLHGGLKISKSDDTTPPVEGKDKNGKTQPIYFLMAELRRYKKGFNKERKGAELHAVNFASLSDLMVEQHPFWIQTIYTEKKGGMGRGMIRISHEVIIGHVGLVNKERFSELVQDPNADIKTLSLDQAMNLPWADAESRQPFQNTYIRVLQQAIQDAEVQMSFNQL